MVAVSGACQWVVLSARVVAGAVVARLRVSSAVASAVAVVAFAGLLVAAAQWLAQALALRAFPGDSKLWPAMT